MKLEKIILLNWEYFFIASLSFHTCKVHILHLQLSWSSAAAQLSDHDKFKSNYRLAPSEKNYSPGMAALLRHYKWKQIAILTQMESLFLAVGPRGSVCYYSHPFLLFICLQLFTFSQSLTVPSLPFFHLRCFCAFVCPLFLFFSPSSLSVSPSFLSPFLPLSLHSLPLSLGLSVTSLSLFLWQSQRLVIHLLPEVNFVTREFASDKNPLKTGDFFVNSLDMRVFVLNMYVDHARTILCEVGIT